MRSMRTVALLMTAMLAGGCSDDAGDDGGFGSGDSNGPTAPAGGTTSGGGSGDSLTEGSSDGATAGTAADDTADTTGGTTLDSAGGSTMGSTDTTASGSDSSGAGSSTDGETGETSSSGGSVVNDDPFDPESCGGEPLSLEDATAALAGMDRQILASATTQVRQRSCPAGACGEWGEAYDWVITYLTWSGGVTTAYKDFQADMQLVVFDDQGTARLSLQHVTFDVPSSTYDDEDGMVYDLPPSPINFPHVRAYDANPDSEYYYQELDWQVRNGTLTVGEDCVRWVADPYVQQPPFTEQYAVVFHW